MENSISFLSLRNITKVYKQGSENIYALKNINLDIENGDFIAIVGPSGSGKTTFVNILGCLDNPTSGTMTISGKLIFGNNRKLSETELTKIRRQYFGYIFQKFFLIPTLTVEENVLLPFTFYKKEKMIDNKKFEELLDLLGLSHRRKHLPGQISGGEMQRVAIARALVNNPKILVADEPTGNLDTKKTDEIGRIFIELNKVNKYTIIMVTHNIELAHKANKILELRDGSIVE